MKILDFSTEKSAHLKSVNFFYLVTDRQLMKTISSAFRRSKAAGRAMFFRLDRSLIYSEVKQEKLLSSRRILYRGRAFVLFSDLLQTTDFINFT